jgi:hypothetical protein
MSIVQQARKRFPVSGAVFHGGFEQGLLNVSRHIGPNVDGGLPQQAGKAFVGHVDPHPCVSFNGPGRGTAGDHSRSKAAFRHGSLAEGISHQAARLDLERVNAI